VDSVSRAPPLEYQATCIDSRWLVTAWDTGSKYANVSADAAGQLASNVTRAPAGIAVRSTDVPPTVAVRGTSCGFRFSWYAAANAVAAAASAFVRSQWMRASSKAVSLPVRSARSGW